MSILLQWGAGVVFILIALAVSFSINTVLAFLTGCFGPLLGTVLTVILYGTIVPIVIGMFLLRGD